MSNSSKSESNSVDGPNCLTVVKNLVDKKIPNILVGQIKLAAVTERLLNFNWGRS